MSKLPWVYGAAASFLVGAAILYQTGFQPVALVGVDEGEIPIQIAQTVKVSTPVVVLLKGELHAANEIDVNAGVTGKVSQIRYETGDWVRSGAVVATLQSPELVERLKKVEATVESAQLEVRQRQSQRSEAEKQLQKIQEWHDRNLIARADLERALASMETADAEVAL